VDARLKAGHDDGGEGSLFFILSKTVGVLLMPTNFLIVLALVGVVLSLTRFARAGRRIVIAAIALLTLAAFSPLGNLLLYPLESRFPQWNAAQGPPDGIVVLGGPIDPDLSMAHNVPVIRAAPDRIVAAAALALKYPNAKMVFSGGSSSLISNEAREADYAAATFESLGVAKGRLIMDRASRNTYENAVLSRQLAAPKPGERWLLVTSAYHMPRAVGLFRKAGFAVEPYPVDWHVGRDTADILAFTQFSTDGLVRTDIAVREWFGLVAYWLAGRTSALFPGPGG
jgi:uncharacterized SAM-binding protein YcdF (DUF218 family)